MMDINSEINCTPDFFLLLKNKEGSKCLKIKKGLKK